MNKHIISASLYSNNEIEVIYYIDNSDVNSLSFYLLDKDDKKTVLSKTVRINGETARILLSSNDTLELGRDYRLICNNDEQIYLDYEDYCNSREFVDKYTYLGNDLGCTYSKKSSTFKIYSPLASKAMVKLEKDDNKFLLLEMSKEENGVFSTTIKGDLLCKKYAYILKINGVDRQLRDPYGKGMSLNSEYSVVVDLSIVNDIKNCEPKTKIDGLKDKIIYEVNIRDFTDKETGRATYGTFIQKIPYLYYLGITYVQFQPILDFDNVNDLTPDTYNWGYDPVSFFSLEGSYSAYPEDPHSRMVEFKNLVNKLHEAGIRVVMDVVYNHVYEYITSDLEKSFPGYYFRKSNNRLCNGSGCGNDVASEKPMVRKHIVDSIKYLLQTYDIDGLRFDLMGLIDIKTSQEIVKEAQAIKKDVFLYGEGWDMLTNLQREEKTSSNNAKMIPEVGFFNAGFRDIIKGETFNATSKGYISGNLDRRGDVENALFGSVLSNNLVNASQSINYIECHDNQTLFDKLSAIHSNQNEILKRVKFANALTILALGVPFIHMGQEIGMSKFGLDNSYNVLNVNSMDWELVKERKEMINFVSDLTNVRKSYDIFNLKSREEIANTFEVYQHDNGLFTIKIKNEKYLYGNKDIVIIINPTDKNIPYELDDYYKVFLNSCGLVQQDIFVKNVLCSYASIRILIKK